MKFIAIFFVLIQIVLLGCRKDSNETLFDGVVVDNLTHTPIPYANVELMMAEGRYFSPAQPLINPVYYQTVSDANGRFQFVEPAETKHIYTITASKTNYGCIMDPNINPIDRTFTNSTHFYNTIYLDKPTVLEIICSDTVSTSLNDSLQIKARFIHTAPYFYTDSYHFGIISLGTTISFSDIIPSTYTNVDINWKVLNSGVLADVDTTITLIQSDTNTVDIFY